jgi:hypothetical protein
MDLIERLRPRWRHPDPDVRAAAVRELGEQEQERLATIARSDPDARVRRAAIKRLDDPVVLEGLVHGEAEPAVRDLAVERVRETRVAIASSSRPLAECEAALASLTDDRSLVAVATAGAHESLRRAALARATGDRVLRDVVRSAADPAIRREALDRIGDAGVLRSIAVGDGPLEVALHALERIDDVDVLRVIAESRSAAKSVRQRARTLVPAGAAEASRLAFKAGRARQIELCATVDALTGEADVLRAAERVREAQRAWRELASTVPPRNDLIRRFETGCEAILEQAASLERRLVGAEHVRLAREESLNARKALCAQVEALDGPDAARALAAARSAWSRLSPVPEEEGVALWRRFALACEACTTRHHAWLAHEKLRAELETLVEEADALADATPPPAPKIWQAMEKRWAARQPTDRLTDDVRALQRRFTDAGMRLHQRRQETDERRAELRHENLTRLEKLCARAEELATSPTLKPSTGRTELQAMEAALVDLGPLPPSERRAAWTERLSAAHDRLLRRLRQEEETEEWRRWANVNAQEEIIRRVEGLLESNDLAEGTRLLGRLQDEWAKVATATPEKSRALWERFRTVRNELHRRCDAYLAENLEKKRALCAQVEGLGDSTNWNETAELIKGIQAEWKQIGPVPGKHAQTLWQQFREPCDRFFARRKEHFNHVDAERRENAQKKIALCEQAEALADSTDWEATTTVMKQLQAAWKQSGPLPRAQSEALWQRFRTACDRFFDRRNRREEIARETQVQLAQAICDDVDALATALTGEDAPAAEQVGQTLDERWGEWLRLDLGTRDDVRALAERLYAACERIAATQPESLRGTRLDPEATRKRREKLCARLEELVPPPAEAPRQKSLQEMALALRDKLATNTIAGSASGGAGRRQDVAREVERITASWAHLGPALDADARALAERFASARARATAGSK